MARTFNGSNEYLEITQAPTASYPFSWSVWFYPTQSTVTKSIIQQYDDGSSGYFQLAMASVGAGQFLYFRTQNGVGENAITINTYTTDVWNYGCVIATSSTDRKIYLNTGSVGTSTTDIVPTVSDLKIASNEADTAPFQGRIAECAMWNTALTVEEKSLLQLGFSPLAVRPQSLVAYWPLIGNLSPEPDLLENKYNLTLVNTPAKANHPPIMYPVSPQIIHVPVTSIDRLPQKLYRPISEERSRLIAALQL